MKTFNRRISRKRRAAAESGVALVLVMLFLGLMLLLGLAVTMTSITEVNVSGNLRYQTEAFQTADAGAIHAYELVRNMRGDFTCLLRGSDTTLKNGDEFAQRPAKTWNGSSLVAVPDGSNMFVSSKTTPISQSGTQALAVLDARHCYELIPYDDAADTKSYMADSTTEADGDRSIDTNQRIMIRSIGYVMDRDTDTTNFAYSHVIASSVVDIVLGLNPYPAIISNDDINLTNSIAVTGSNGSVHANNDLLLGTGNFTVSQSATFANNDGVTPSGWDSTADDTHVTGYNGPASAVYIPDLNPQSYAQDCKLLLIHESTSNTERQALINQMNAADTTKRPGDAVVAAFTAASKTLTSSGSFLLRQTSAPDSSGSGSYAYSIVSTQNGNGSLSETTYGYSLSVQTSGGSQGAHVTGISSTQANGVGVFALLPLGPGDAEIEINSNLNGYVSVFTNANVHVNGNSNLFPALFITPPEQPPWDRVAVLVLAGEDIVMNGNGAAGDTIRGVLYSHEGFDLSGSGAIQGQVIGYEKTLDYNSGTGLYASHSTYSTTNHSPVDVDGSTVHGNFTITFNAGQGFLGTFSLTSWRQLHDFDPSSAAR